MDTGSRKTRPVCPASVWNTSTVAPSVAPKPGPIVTSASPRQRIAAQAIDPQWLRDQYARGSYSDIAAELGVTTETPPDVRGAVEGSLRGW